MGEKIARYYVADKNPDSGFFPGVPLRDLTEDEYEGLPDWLQKSVDAHDMYRKTAPRKEAAATSAEEAETTDNEDNPTPDQDGGN